MKKMNTSKIDMRVAEITKLTPEVSSYRLVRIDGSAVPAFAAGAHIDVVLADGLQRQYSLCNGPDDKNHYSIAVKREADSRGGSRAIHETFRIGSAVSVGLPRNNFPIEAGASEHLLIAAGIGVTPLLSMARHLKAASRPFKLEYFTRSAELTAFADEIRSEFGDAATVHAGTSLAELPSRLADILVRRASDQHAYICGPAPFMKLASNIAGASWPASAVHMEHFAPDSEKSFGETRPFKVQISGKSKTFDVPADKSILDVLLENGIACDFSCKEGTCGSCLVGVSSGEIDHRDSFLSDAEKADGETMVICVSRAKGDLIVIDL